MISTSIFLAKAFGIYFLVMSVALFFRRQQLEMAIQELVKRLDAQLVLAVMTLILGILLVLFHNVWVANWRVVITILAWLTLLKGVLRVLFLGSFERHVPFFQNRNVYYVVTFVVFLLGLYLFYEGFVV